MTAGWHTRCARFPVAGLGLRCSVPGPRRRFGTGYRVPGAGYPGPGGMPGSRFENPHMGLASSWGSGTIPSLIPPSLVTPSPRHSVTLFLHPCRPGPLLPPASLPYCPIALLPYCLIALLPYCPIARLPSCLTALLPHSPLLCKNPPDGSMEIPAPRVPIFESIPGDFHPPGTTPVPSPAPQGPSSQNPFGPPCESLIEPPPKTHGAGSFPPPSSQPLASQGPPAYPKNRCSLKTETRLKGMET
jgi:hypothetical protein